MNINKSFPSNYLKASDIEGENLTLTVASVAEEEIGQQRDKKPVVYFEEVERGLVLNKTNAVTISEVLGSYETAEWVGKKITLYPLEVEWQGKMVESIRVRLRAPRPASAAAAPPPAQSRPNPRIENPYDQEDSIPF